MCMALPLTPPRRDCTRCPLHATAHCPGIPTCPRGEVRGTRKALLLVGEAPGREEDEIGSPFVGPSGMFLDNVYIKGGKLSEVADLYVTNAVRCRPPKNAKPSKGQRNACQPWLLADLRELQKRHEEVVILCLGATACESLLGMSLQKSFTRQGQPQEWGWAGTENLRPCPVFTTFHPAVLLNKRQPNRVVAIRDHLHLVHRYLSGQPLCTDAAPSVTVCPELPPYPIDRLSLDIETYGKVESYPPQRCFHPVKSTVLDTVLDQVVTVALAWRNPDGVLESGVFLFGDPVHRRRLREFLARVREQGELVGMNLKFDLMYLRANCALIANQVVPTRYRLVDLSVLNYLHSEQRPERSLKALAPLLQVATYSSEEADGGHRYPTADDPRLLAYNVKDAVATLEAVEALEARIRSDYPGSSKLTEYSRQWYSNLLWTCLLMEECGVAFNAESLDELDFHTVLAAALCYSEASARWNLILAGKGSDKSKYELFLEAITAAGLEGDPRLERTEKTDRISINQKNANLLLEYLPPESLSARKLRLQQRYEGLVKIVQSYTRPMLHGTTKNPVASLLIQVPHPVWNARRGVRIGYPSWFPVPSSFDSGTEGGTIQGRITSKGPACQTMPKAIKTCLTTRYNPGFLLCVDLSQIELRIAALVSGDPVMLQEYEDGIDRHTQTGVVIIRALLDHLHATRRGEVQLDKEVYSVGELTGYLNTDPVTLKKIERFVVLRQMGKTTNFLIIYHGSAGKLQSTVATDLGVVLPLPVCQRIITGQYQRYRVLAEYQADLLRTAQTRGRIELPLTGQSRVFIGSPKVVEQTYGSEIVNFPIQTQAANVMLDIQYAMTRWLLTRRRRTYLGLNIYDSIFLDGPMSEYGFVVDAVHHIFRRSDYLARLEAHLDRKVPIDYDISVLVQDSTPILQAA